jgi:hypothetical protein
LAPGISPVGTLIYDEILVIAIRLFRAGGRRTRVMAGDGAIPFPRRATSRNL